MKLTVLSLAVAVAVAVAGCGSDEPTAEQAAVAPQPPSIIAPAERAEPAEPPDGVPPPTEEQPASLPPPPTAPATPASPAHSGPECALGNVHAVGDDTVAFAAIARRPLAARRTPNGEALAHFDTVNANGHAMVFQIRGVVRDGCGMLWYYASLPMRPNGVAGFVPARDVRIHRLHTRITVELSRRELVLYRDAEPVLRSAVAIGAPETPTPTGRYYVNQRLIASDPSGPWGPGALGISAFSDVLQEWIQGGPIGIHGTNDASSIGQAVSHGCIRLPNDVLMRVFNTADAGTPVIIQA